MDCNLSGHVQRAKATVKIVALEMPQRYSYRCLCLMMSKDGEIKGDVKAAREKVRAEFTAKCIATPHDELPDYKPF